MPKLWTETIEAHRREVRDAILDATITLVEERGLLGVTMSQIAEGAGIGRATLYKYFPHVEAILRSWHEREIDRHLGELVEVTRQPGEPEERLAAVLHAYAVIAHESGRHADSDLGGLLHRDEHVAGAEQRLHKLVRGLIAEAADAGQIRDDAAPDELASYCLHSLAAARTTKTRTAVRRLVKITLAGLQPEH